MLDIKFFRDPEGLARVKNDLRKRQWNEKLADEVVELDEEWRKSLHEASELRAAVKSSGRQYAMVGKSYKQTMAAFSSMVKATAVISKFMKRRGQPRSPVGDVIDAVFDRRRLRTYVSAVIQYANSYPLFTLAATEFAQFYRSGYVEVENLPRDSQAVQRLDSLLESAREHNGEAQELAESVAIVLGKERLPQRAKDTVIQKIESASFWRVEVDAIRNLVRDLNAPIQNQMAGLTQRQEQFQKRSDQAHMKRDTLLRRLPNLMHPSVPEGADESNNKPIKSVGGAPTHDFDAVSHVDLLESLDLADLERAARAAGSRFYYGKGDLVMLGRALEFFALQKLQGKGYQPIEPPYMLRREAVEGAVDLSDFEEVIYKVEAGAAAKESKEDAPELFLIATSEHPLAALHMGEILDSDKLPLRYAGVSPCFRKEAGAHGKDQKGIFRVHQFSKVEQFIYAGADDSWDLHEELLQNAEEIYQELEIPYRVMSICTGDLGTVAAKKYDIEAWMPVQGAYREVVSCSNCTDYQARRYNTRYRPDPGADTEFVHTLNSTAVAVQRTLVAILENFQNADGSVTVPEVLRPYLGGKEKVEAATVRS